jgi:predicted esterase
MIERRSRGELSRRPFSTRARKTPPCRRERVRFELRATLTILILTGLASIAGAQESRYELGRRVRAFEQEWARRPDPAARKGASVHLAEAVASFFRFRVDEAARAIGRAQFALDPAHAPTPARRWADALALEPASRLVAAGRSDVPIAVTAFYKADADAPTGARLRLSVRQGDATLSSREARIDVLPATVNAPLEGVPAGDHTLHYEVAIAGAMEASGAYGLSVVADPKARLDAVAKRLPPVDPKARPATADRATAADLLERLRKLAAGDAPETDYPAARLIAELEDLAAALAEGRTFYGPDRPGEFWLTLVTANGSLAPVRVFLPEAARGGKPLTTVVALHGAGGSENMFFDSYGAGAIVGLCRDRGWLLAAPRAGAPPEDVVAALAKVYPVDPSRVFAVGHSMGAAMAVASASKAPATYAGVAALGGGGRLRASDGLKKVRFFVGVGTADFARPGAAALSRALTDAGATTTYREYPDIEHLAVVQVALADVFAFFDGLPRKAP